MAYYRDLSIVDIKDWELGLQDGFKWEKTGSFTNDEDFKGLDIPKKVKRNLFDKYKPYIQTDRGLQVLEKKSDKIVTRLDGTRFVITKEQFEKYYHSDSGMFEPDLGRHAEFEYVVQTFGRAQSELKIILARLSDLADDPNELPRIEKQVENTIEIYKGLTTNLKSKAKDFLDRVKGGKTCRCSDK